MPELPKDAVIKAYVVQGQFPRMALPDLATLGGCSNSQGWPGRADARPVTHEPCIANVILGRDRTIMLDTGHYALWYSLSGQLDAVLQGRPLDYVFVSHQEIPHTGNLGRLLKKYPGCKAVGDVRDYHIFHPEIALERLVQMEHCDELDLGDRRIMFLDAIWKDLQTTLWAYDTRLKLIFSADTFGYIHHADENVCSTMLHEMPRELREAVTDRPALPFFGMRNRDQAARVAAFRNLMTKYPIEIITSGHTLPIMGPATQPAIDKLLAAIANVEQLPRFLQSGVPGHPPDGPEGGQLA